MGSLALDVDLSGLKPITNFEVYELVRQRMESKDKVRSQQTILYTSIKYFNEKSPCPCQSSEELEAFLVSMKKYNLAKTELLSIINNCPTTQVELSVMVPDLDTRFGPAQIEEMISEVKSSFPSGVEKVSQIISSGVAEEDE